ncbi:ACP S-malonyltransferase [Nonomuraea sp. NPDC049649]|uniref:ACP S-malonyltransferase n=1 Tax=Nonomuraea sp. NPDC049649 TaxID=3155776 RepID=UPI00342F21EE
MSGVAFVFPGMGPAGTGEAVAFMRGDPVAGELAGRASDTLGYDVAERFAEGDHDYSESAQVVFLVNCLALASWAERELGLTPDLCVGPSFGGKPAAAYAQALGFEQAVRMTAGIARLTEAYFAEAHPGVVTHSFVRVPGPAQAEIMADLDRRGVWHELSCRVDHDFVMLSLPGTELEWLDGQIRKAGGLSLYTMRPPMHAAAFAPLRRRVEREVLPELEFADPKLPVLDDADGTALTTGEQVRGLLLDAFVRPPSWPKAVEAMRRRGVGRICVTGQDSLFGRVPITRRNFAVVAVNPRLALKGR